MKMKKLMALVLALTLVLALAACGQTSTPAEGGDTTVPAEGEQTLIVYTARSESLNNAVIENFEADTGIHVEVVTGGTGEVLKHGDGFDDESVKDHIVDAVKGFSKKGGSDE